MILFLTQMTVPPTELDEAIKSIVKSDDEIVPCPNNRMTREEAEKVITQRTSHRNAYKLLYPDYYKLMNEKDKLRRGIKRAKDDETVQRLRARMTEVREQMQKCENKPKRAKY